MPDEDEGPGVTPLDELKLGWRLASERADHAELRMGRALEDLEHERRAWHAERLELRARALAAEKRATEAESHSAHVQAKERWARDRALLVARAEAAERRAEELEDVLRGERSEFLDVLGAANASEDARIAAEALLREARELVRRFYAGTYLTVAGDDWNLRADADALLAKLAAREGGT